ncbi:transcriptional regulator, partial [Erysipelatoclostridium ramosum]|nr:transcriptional regulator [Thomasclavelia ramosa]
YNTLLEKQMHDAFFDTYEVICIVGTLNPNLEGIRFIPIEDLIINDTLDELKIYFQDYMREDEMKTFQQNILKNFSLSNIMNNLTILNPNKLLEHVADAIDKLQLE